MRRGIRAQSTLEYAMIIAVVVGGLIAMQIYMKRGVEGKLRESTDDIGYQFDAEKTTFDHTLKRPGTSVQTITGGVTTSSITDGERTETRTETVSEWGDEEE